MWVRVRYGELKSAHGGGDGLLIHLERGGPSNRYGNRCPCFDVGVGGPQSRNATSFIFNFWDHDILVKNATPQPVEGTRKVKSNKLGSCSLPFPVLGNLVFFSPSRVYYRVSKFEQAA